MLETVAPFALSALHEHRTHTQPFDIDPLWVEGLALDDNNMGLSVSVGD